MQLLLDLIGYATISSAVTEDILKNWSESLRLSDLPEAGGAKLACQLCEISYAIGSQNFGEVKKNVTVW